MTKKRKNSAAKKAAAKKPRGLTPRQAKFALIYDGNGTDAARKAGYRGSEDVLGKTAHDLLRNPKVKKAIESRQTKETAPLIASREERQKFWTTTMNSKKTSMKDRLKASELLGRSEADFVEKHAHFGADGGPVKHVIEVEFVEPGNKD